MRLLFIRHADPDYAHDSLTEAGEREAKALAALAPRLGIDRCYVSPLGRAQRTASYTLAAIGKTADTLGWLREFPAQVHPDPEGELTHAYDWTESPVSGSHILWDMLPAYMTAHPEYYDPAGWRTSAAARNSDLVSLYDETAAALDSLLAGFGYVRDGLGYRVERESRETLVFFCHFGVSGMLLSHLMNCSPFVLWHHTCMLPSAVSELYSEEREQGTAAFRAARLGDLSHLALAGLQPSFSARFTDVWSDRTLRH